MEVLMSSPAGEISLIVDEEKSNNLANFMYAVTIGDLNTVDSLVAKVSEAEKPKALLVAALYNQNVIVKYLITEAKIDVNTKESDGSTILFTAISNGNPELVLWLIDKAKASLTVKKNNGESILQHALTTLEDNYDFIASTLEDNDEESALYGENDNEDSDSHEENEYTDFDSFGEFKRLIKKMDSDLYIIKCLLTHPKTDKTAVMMMDLYCKQDCIIAKIINAPELETKLIVDQQLKEQLDELKLKAIDVLVLIDKIQGLTAEQRLQAISVRLTAERFMSELLNNPVQAPSNSHFEAISEQVVANNEGNNNYNNEGNNNVGNNNSSVLFSLQALSINNNNVASSINNINNINNVASNPTAQQTQAAPVIANPGSDITNNSPSGRI